MHADVEDHAGRAHPLSIQHAHTVARILQVAQLLHETLGVQRPTLAVARNPQHVGAPGVHSASQGRSDRNLQVVPRNALMVHGGGFTPGRERILPLGHGPPHAAGTREIRGRPGVVDAALVGGRDATLDAAHRAANCEVFDREICHRRVGELLHPRLQLIGAVQLAARVFIEQLLGALDAGAGLNLLGHLALTGDNTLQLLHAPGIGLIQVDGGTQERTRVQAVRFAAYRIASRGGRL